MIISIKKLATQGKWQGVFRFEYVADNSLIDIPNVRFAQPIKIVGEYEILDEGVQVYADISFELEGECSRCLKNCKMQCECDLDECFKNVDDGESYLLSSGDVDLTQAVIDSIVLNMPMNLLCNENCEGIEYKK